MRGLSGIPGELILARGVLRFEAHGTGSAWAWQLRKLERELRAPGLAAAIERGERCRVFEWPPTAARAWALLYCFGGGIRLRCAGTVLSFSFGRPASLGLRTQANGFGAIAEIRKQVDAVRSMRGRGRRWLSALASASGGDDGDGVPVRRKTRASSRRD